MARRELLAGYTHEIAKMLGITPTEDANSVKIVGQIDCFGRRVSLSGRCPTPAVIVTEIIIRDRATGEVKDSADLINGEFKTLPRGGIKIVDAKQDSLTVSPEFPAKVHHSQPPARY